MDISRYIYIYLIMEDILIQNRLCAYTANNDHRDFRRLRVIASSIIIAFQTFIPCRCHVALVYRS